MARTRTRRSPTSSVLFFSRWIDPKAAQTTRLLQVGSIGAEGGGVPRLSVVPRRLREVHRRRSTLPSVPVQTRGVKDRLIQRRDDLNDRDRKTGGSLDEASVEPHDGGDRNGGVAHGYRSRLRSRPSSAMRARSARGRRIPRFPLPLDAPTKISSVESSSNRSRSRSVST